MYVAISPVTSSANIKISAARVLMDTCGMWVYREVLKM
jgi:hypothetical protein